MADVAKCKLVVLWEHEIRIAAKACAKLLKVVQDKAGDEKVSDAARECFDACTAALAGAEDDAAQLVITSVPKTRKKAK